MRVSTCHFARQANTEPLALYNATNASGQQKADWQGAS